MTKSGKIASKNDSIGGSLFAEMSSHELERFLEFFSRLLHETEDCLGQAVLGRDLQIPLLLMRSHLRGRTETPSSLIAASGLPRGTAHRMIEAMLVAGLITRRPRTRTGKTFTLHPSPKLIRQWLDYARRMKALLGTAFGLSNNVDYFFGASYLSASVIPPLPALEQKLELKDGLRLVLHADPAFLAMQKVKQQLELHFGTELEVRALSIDRLHREILENADRPQSRFDIVTCDLCWMTELIDRGIVQPVAALTGSDSADIRDFHPEALATTQRANELYGLPVQTTPELLIYRTDLLNEAGLDPPQTPEELLTCARRLHDPAAGINGICWNGAHGTPVGTTFMMLMADFGQPVLNLARTGNSFTDRNMRPENLRPMLDGPTALAAAEFLVELLTVSPDNVLQMSWFERAQCYSRGQAAMAYCYTQIMPMFESDPNMPAHGLTGYAAHPARIGVPRIAPLGGWNLCVPSNVRSDRLPAVRTAVRVLTSAEATKLYIENGSLVSSRFSVCNDPAVAHGRPIIPIVDRLARAGQLQTWVRPAIVELNDLVRILGDEIHMMLLRNKKPRAALRDAQARCDRLMRQNGRY